MDVLLISDMLRDFIGEDGALYCGAPAKKIIPFIRSKIDECRLSGGKIIYTCDSHRPDDPEFSMFKPHCVEGTEGARIIDELEPRKDDIIIKKTTFSSFYGTELEKVLKELAPETVYVAGVCTSICVMDAVGVFWIMLKQTMLRIVSERVARHQGMAGAANPSRCVT